LGVINQRERHEGGSQRGAQRNIFTAEIKRVGPAGVGQLELRVEVARRLAVFDDADRDVRLVVNEGVRQSQTGVNVLQEAIDSKQAVTAQAGLG